VSEEAQRNAGTAPLGRRAVGNDEPVIRATGVTKSYRRGRQLVQALRGVDLEICTGEFVTLMGPSGCGKSTLLHTIGGIDRPTSGTLSVGGVDIGSADESTLTALRRRVGIVFQFLNLLPTLTALENVELPLIALGHGRSDRRQMAEEMLEAVGLGDRLDHRPAELSGGEQQRVAIARATVTRPSVVLADEPTGDLDSASGQLVLDLMEELHRGLGLTFLTATHDRAIGERGERQLMMKDGHIVSDPQAPGSRRPHPS
jgi:putative ABC transport system ATP-binding protein